jgi:putative membrane protein
VIYPFTPYCGAPPFPSALWARWNLDPLLLGALALLLIGYVAAGKGEDCGLKWRHRSWFYSGFAVAALALVTPLCPLSVALFSARVGQHLILTTIAAPMMALGLPRLRRTLARAPLLAAATFAITLWIWHSPGPYTATFTSDAAYWGMHATTIAAALAFWAGVLGAAPRRLAVSMAATLATSLQMALLGAVITFAPRALYAPHALTTSAWGLSPLRDQQLGGVLMWAPAGLIFAVAVVAPLARVMRRDPAPSSAMVAG